MLCQPENLCIYATFRPHTGKTPTPQVTHLTKSVTTRPMRRYPPQRNNSNTTATLQDSHLA